MICLSNVTDSLRRLARYAAIAATTALVACGGPSGGGSASSTPTTTPNGSLSMSIDVSVVDVGTPATVTALVLGPDGKPAVNKKVTFTTDAAFAFLNPSSGTSLTNGEGKAVIQLIVGPSAGAATITAENTDVNAKNTLGYTSKGGGSAPAERVALKLDVTTIDPAVTATATATFYGIDGRPASGRKLTFTVDQDFAFLSPVSGSVLTDTNGQATVQLRAGTLIGAATLRVVSDGAVAVSNSVNFNSKGGGRVAAESLTLAISSTTVDINTPAKLTATFLGADGKPQVGKKLTFLTDVNFATFNPVSGTSLTDANGTASLQLLAGRTAGAATVVVSTDSSTPTTQTINYTSRGGGVPPAETLLLSLDKTTIGATTSAVATATLLGSDGRPSVGKVITFAVNNQNIGLLSPTSNGVATALTDAKGNATIKLLPGTDAGAATLTASTNLQPVATVQNVNFSSTGGGRPIAQTLILSFDSPIVDVTRPATATATLIGADGKPEAGQLIVFTTVGNFGQLSPSSGQVATNANGQATIQVIAAAGTSVGAAPLTATLSTNKATTDTAIFTNMGSGGKTPSESLNLSTSAQTIDSNTPAVITATLVGLDSKPVVGKKLTFSLVGADATLASLNPTSGTTLTDSSGTATIQLRAGASAGAGTLSVLSETGSQKTINFTSRGGGSLPAETLKLQIDRAGVVVGSPATATLTLLGSNGLPAAGKTIKFETDKTIGFLNPATGTALTDANGNASIQILAGLNAGAAVVTATSELGNKATASFSSGGNGKPTAETLILSFDSPLVDINRVAVATARLIDANGAAISGKQITFKTDSNYGQLIPASGTALTDANGVASIQVQAGITPGAGILVATSETAATTTDSRSYANKGAGILSLTLDVNTIDASTPGTITAKLVGSDGTPAPGKRIVFTNNAPTSGLFNPNTGVVTTDATGTATIQLLAGAAATTQPALVTAKTDLGVTSTVSFSSKGGGGSTVRLSKIVLNTSTKSLKTDNSNSATITATALDQGNAVMSGIALSFSSSSGQLIVPAGSTTDATGQIKATFSAGNDASNRTDTITVTGVGGISSQVAIAVSGTAVALTPKQTNLATGVATTMTVTLTDAGGAPITGQNIALASNGTGSVTFSKNSVQTGETVTVTGNTPGAATVTATALNAQATAPFTVTPGNAFGFALPTSPQALPSLIYTCQVITSCTTSNPSTPIGTKAIVTINAPSVNGSIQLSTTLGVFANPSNPFSTAQSVNLPVINGVATAEFTSNKAGTATINALDLTGQNLSASTSIVISPPIQDAAKITVQATPSTVPVSIGGNANTTTIKARVTNSIGQPIGNAPVLFTIINPAGGGETLTPSFAFTSTTASSGLAIGEAKAVFASGSVPSSQNPSSALQIKAEVVGQPAVPSAQTPVTISAIAASVTIGQSTKISAINNDTAYQLPMSVQVSDSAGNPVNGAVVTLKVEPFAFSPGTACTVRTTYAAEDRLGDYASSIAQVAALNLPQSSVGNQSLDTSEDGNRVELNNSTFDRITNCVNPLYTFLLNGQTVSPTYACGYNEQVRFTFTTDAATGVVTPNEFRSSVAGTRDGQLTPAQSNAGGLPSTVTTDASGVATFNYTYLKANSIWTVVRVTATTFVGTTEASQSVKFRLAALQGDVSPCFIPDSTYAY